MDSTTSERDTSPGIYGINGVIPGAGRCAACNEPALRGRLMCRSCQGRVPAVERARLSDAMGRWRTGTSTLADLREAQWACVEALTGGSHHDTVLADGPCASQDGP